MIIIVEYRNRVKAYRIKTTVREKCRVEKGEIKSSYRITGANYEEISLDAVKEAQQAGELVMSIGGKDGSSTLPGFEDSTGTII